MYRYVCVCAGVFNPLKCTMGGKECLTCRFSIWLYALHL